MHTTWAAWQAALYFDGRSRSREALRGNGNKKNEGKRGSKWEGT